MAATSGAEPLNRWAKRRSLLVVAALAVLLAPTVIGVRAAVRSNVNDVRDWLPAHFEETRQYQWFRSQFGSEEFVVVSWPGCVLDDPRLANVAARLRDRSTLAQQRGTGPLFTRVTTGAELVDEMTSDRLGFTKRVAVERLRGTLIGPDGQQTCAVVTLSDSARIRLRQVLGEIRRATLEGGVAENEIHLGGPAVVNDAIDRSSTQSLVRLAGLAGLVGILVAWVCFREIRLTLIVFFIAGYSAALSLAAAPLLGVPVNAILITMVPLVYVAAMSGAIHLSNYYREGLRSVGAGRAIQEALSHAALPLTLATATTAIGLLSLWYSDLAPIRLFGVFSALGVLIGLAMQLVALPALLDLISTSVPTGTPLNAQHSASPESGLEPLAPGWQQILRATTRFHLACSSLFVILLALGVAGLSRVETSIQIMRLFSPKTPVVSSYAWLEEKLGALVPLEVVVRFDSTNSLDATQRLRVVRQIHEQIGEVPGVSGSLSAATFLPKQSSQGASLRGAVASVRLRRALARLAEAGYWRTTDEGEAWRISVRVAAGEDLDYGEFQRALRERVEPTITAERLAGRTGITAIYTGAVPIIYKARRGLLDGLIFGFSTDVTLVVVSAWLLLRHWTSGLLLFLTSIFPMTIVFGTMGWCGWVVDIGSVMAPCVALGVTIDDAIHFVLWFGRGSARGLARVPAIELAYSVCGQAMVQSWGVIGIGLSVFALSDFVPTFRFGALTLALLTAALLCNLVFLPALLAGPIGGWFARAARRRAGHVV